MHCLYLDFFGDFSGHKSDEENGMFYIPFCGRHLEPGFHSKYLPGTPATFRKLVHDLLMRSKCINGRIICWIDSQRFISKRKYSIREVTLVIFS